MGKHLNTTTSRITSRKLVINVPTDKDFDEFMFSRYSESMGIPAKTMESVFTELIQTAYRLRPELRKIIRTNPRLKEASITLIFKYVYDPELINLQTPNIKIVCSVMADLILESAYKRDILTRLTKDIADFTNRIKDIEERDFTLDGLKLSVGSNIYPIETHEALLTLLYHLISKYIDVTKGFPKQPDTDKTIVLELWTMLSSYIPSSVKKNATRIYRVTLGNFLGEALWATSNRIKSRTGVSIMNTPPLLNVKATEQFQGMSVRDTVDALITTSTTVIGSGQINKFGTYKEAYPNPELFLTGYFLSAIDDPDWIRFSAFLDILVNEVIRFTKYGIKKYESSLIIERGDYDGRKVNLEQEDEIRNVCDLVLNPLGFVPAADEDNNAYNGEALFSFGLNLFTENLPQIDLDTFVEKTNQMLTVIYPESEMVKGALTMLGLLSQLRVINPPDAEKIDAFNHQEAKLEDEVKQLRQQLEDAEKRLKVRDADVKALSNELDIKSRQYAAMEKTIDDLRKDKKSLQEDLDEMLDTIGNLSSPNTDETNDDIPNFPASLNGKKIISFGGFPSFITSIKNLLPELNVKEAERRPDAAALVSADAVFLQVNCMKHSDFYYVAGKCKENGIPVITYQSPSPRLCAKQILDYLSSHPTP